MGEATNKKRACASFLERLVMFLLPRIFWRNNVKKGQVYIFDDSDAKNPFIEKPHIVRVKAVKNKFVNYEFIHGELYKNESLPISRFNFCYKLHSET